MKKKYSTGFIIGISAAYAVVFTAVVWAVVFFAGKRIVKSPELRLTTGIANMLLEVAEYDTSLSREIDFDAIQELRDTGTIHTDTKISITLPERGLNNVSFHIDALTNISEKKADYDIGAGMYGFEMPFADIAATSDTLYVSVPMIFKDTYSIGLTRLGEDFNNSAWAALIDRELPQDYSIALFETDNEEAGYGTWNRFYQTLKDNVRYQNIEEKKEGYTGVRVLLDQESADRCVEALVQDMQKSASYEAYKQKNQDADKMAEALADMRFVTDCMLDFYFDEKGRIVNIATPADIETADGGAVSIDISFFGEERVLDVIAGNIYVKDGGSIYHMYIDRRGDVSDTLYSEDLTIMLQTDSSGDDILFSYRNEFGKENLDFDMEVFIKTPDTRLKLCADGEFTDIVKGEGYTFRVNNAALAVDNEELCYASIVSKLEPSDESPEIPKSAQDLLAMDTLEIQQLLYEVMSSVRTLDYD